MMMNELPVDVLSKIASYYLGDAKYIRLKHNKNFRRIQNEFKITYEDTHTFFSGDIERYIWHYTIKGKYISPLSISNQWIRIIDFYYRFIDEQIDEDDDEEDDISLLITSEIIYTLTKQDTNSSQSEIRGVYVKLLNPNRWYIESELEKMAKRAKNELERTRQEFTENGGKSLEIKYITMKIKVETEE